MTQLYPDPYGAPWTLPWMRMMLQWQGGILQMFLLEWFVAVALCAATMTAFYFAWKGNTEVPHNVESLIEATMFIARRFQAAIALMLGFYSVQNFTRWREVRNKEGDTMATINDLALQIAWRIRDRSDADECDDRSKSVTSKATSVRLKLIRWLNLSHAIVVGDIFAGKRNEFSSMDNLVRYGLASNTERSLLEKHQDTRFKFVAPILWFIDFVEELQRKELFGVTEGTVNTLSVGAMAIRRSMADLYGIKGTPIPLSYRQLTNFSVRLYLLILLFAAALSEKEDEYEFGQLSKGAFWVIMVYAFEYFLFVGWLTVADAIGNPFGAWADQLDWDNYVKEINMSSLLIASRFGGETLSEDTDEAWDDDESEDDEKELEKLEVTCRNWKRLLQQKNGRKHPRPKGFKERRKMMTGW